ncbi:MAG: M20 family metallopeptidase [Rhodothermia bacterium]|nr:MAG: M20 family metallopeptidase [Rhodothermia bacterium]
MTETHRLIGSPLDELNQMSDLSAVPQNLSPMLTSIRRHLHKNPEIGLAEYETSRFIREVLEMHGLDVQGPFAETGLWVDIKGEHPGPMVAFRADIDALPIQDTKDVPYASVNPDLAHLCGHDVHAAFAIGVALLLSGLRHLMHGSVRVFFQPNEEGAPSGAPLMIEEGVLEGVEAAFACHVDPTLPVGKFGLASGPLTASADRFRIRVMAPTTGHSARPHQSVDTIWIATQIMSDLYQLIGRVTDARNSAVLTICRVHAGEAYNVLPAIAELGGTFRCTEHADRDRIRDQIMRTASELGKMHEAETHVHFDTGSPPVINDKDLVKLVEETIIETHGPEAIFEIPRPSMGAEDFAHYLTHVPGMLLRVGTSTGPDTSHPLHDSDFDVDEASLSPTSQLMSRVLIKALQRPTNGSI